MSAKPKLRLVKPAIQKRAVGPLRRPNSELRSREHLTETEVEKLIKAARGNRYGHRDATMTLVAYRHGLRASEVISDACVGLLRVENHARWQTTLLLHAPRWRSNDNSRHSGR